MKTFKYRIYPDKAQRKQIDETLEFCRFLYNCALEERIRSWSSRKISISCFDQMKHLKEIKSLFPKETANIYSQVLQQVLKLVDTAFQNFFIGIKQGRKVGYPRFKGKNRFNSICFPQISASLNKLPGIKRLESGIKISKIDRKIKCDLHRLPKGNCKQARIVREADKYYLCVVADDKTCNFLPETGNTIALDLGISSFYTTNNGDKIKQPRVNSNRIAKLQEKLSKKKERSKNRDKARKTLQKEYRKNTNRREDFQHKTANNLIKNNDVIIIEELDIDSMMQSVASSGLHEKISQAGWGNFVAKLEYKAENAGRVVIKVDARNTSKMCSCCKNIKTNLTLQDRIYNCSRCGMVMDRDHNAALNILRRGTRHEEDEHLFPLKNLLSKSLYPIGYK